MKKRKLWIYGCSYSDYWGDESKRNDNCWIRLLQKELDLECIHHTDDEEANTFYHHAVNDRWITTWRNYAGRGWSYHKDIILEDFLHWKPEDIVIIEESVRQRAFTPYLRDNHGWGSETPSNYSELQDTKVLPYCKETIQAPQGFRAIEVFNPNNIDEKDYQRYQMNKDIRSLHMYRELVSWKSFYDMINIILTIRPTNTFTWHFAGEDISGNYIGKWDKDFNPHLYTPTIQPIGGEMKQGLYVTGGWKLPHWKEYKERWKENFLHLPWGRESYQRFIASHPELFCDFGMRDDHQSDIAHKLQAECFVEQIKARMK